MSVLSNTQTRLALDVPIMNFAQVELKLAGVGKGFVLPLVVAVALPDDLTGCIIPCDAVGSLSDLLPTLETTHY